MDQCPKCKSADIHLSRSRSKWEKWRKEVTGKRPFRCLACAWRGWGIESPPTFSEAEIRLALEVIAPGPPTLPGIAPDHDAHQAPELNLDAIDTIGALKDPRR